MAPDGSELFNAILNPTTLAPVRDYTQGQAVAAVMATQERQLVLPVPSLIHAVARTTATGAAKTVFPNRNSKFFATTRGPILSIAAQDSVETGSQDANHNTGQPNKTNTADCDAIATAAPPPHAVSNTTGVAKTMFPNRNSKFSGCPRTYTRYSHPKLY